MSQVECRLPVSEAFTFEYLEYHAFLPLDLSGGVLEVACITELPDDCLAELSGRYHTPHVRCTPMAAEAFMALLRRTFAAHESVLTLVEGLESTSDVTATAMEEEQADARYLASQGPVVRYVNLLLREAYESQASDIHLESRREGLRARLRIDGTLTESTNPPEGLALPIVSRVKLLAGMDIAERRAPQDGRMRVQLEQQSLDVRVSVVPTIHGESLVLRLLERGAEAAALEHLGMPPGVLAAFSGLARRPHGLLLATGPTGSGKTTTLHAALRLRDPLTEKIITVEDPIEYDLPGISQVPVNSKAGVTFAAALRSILRQDPDVVMVGEMRDAETVRTALQAAMTGHLVLSTLHTRNAEGALSRLTQLGAESYLVAATVDAVLAQRLVRRTCEHCRVQETPDPSLVAVLAPAPARHSAAAFSRGAGCGRCRGTGYRGRVGLYELLVVTDELRDLIARAADPSACHRCVTEMPYPRLQQEAWEAVRNGITTVEEACRVVQA